MPANNNNFQVQYADRNLSSAVPRNMGTGVAVPRMDILEDQEKIIYLFELPGINPESLKVNVDESNLYVNAQVEMDKNNVKLLHQERNFGQYTRQIPTPARLEDTNENDITADYHDGILEVKFQKKQNQYQHQPENQV